MWAAGQGDDEEEFLALDIEFHGLVLASSGNEMFLKLNELVAKGAFSTLGSTAEWRGADPARPVTLTIRLGVADGSAPSRSPI